MEFQGCRLGADGDVEGQGHREFVAGVDIGVDVVVQVDLGFGVVGEFAALGVDEFLVVTEVGLRPVAGVGDVDVDEDELSLCGFAQVVAADRFRRRFDRGDDEREFAVAYFGSGGCGGIAVIGYGTGGDAAGGVVGVVGAGGDEASAAAAEQDEEAEDAEDDPERGAVLARGAAGRRNRVRAGRSRRLDDGTTYAAEILDGTTGLAGPFRARGRTLNET